MAGTNRWRSFGQRRVERAERPAELGRPLCFAWPPVNQPGWISLADPHPPFELLQSCPTDKPRLFAFHIQEAADQVRIGAGLLLR